MPYTVAIFRRAVFDEVIEQAGWIFGRKDRGYIALRSQQPVRWTANGVLRGEGLIADGRRNVWICQLGRAADDGPFATWAARIAAAPLAWGDRSVRYDAPGIGRAEFAWEGPLTIDGHPIRLGDHGRFENPYCFSEHGSGRYEIAFRQHRLILDFPAGMRQEHAPNSVLAKANTSQLGQSCIPPSTRSTCPVMYDASSLARNATARATSSGQP